MEDQLVGEPIWDWQPRLSPPKTPMEGRYCRIEPLSLTHARLLFEANQEDKSGASWTYMAYGPFPDFQSYRDWVASACASEDPLFFAILADGKASGVASYMRIEPQVGVLEIGGIHLSPRLQNTRAATEAMFLFMHRAFQELKYRRYEWKCDALNRKSRKAAGRLGFTFEGIFRQATIYKGRNRDTAWFSIIDKEWPRLERAYQGWLDNKNFDSRGKQIQNLGYFMNKA